MAATRSATDARAKLSTLGIVSATVLTGSTTITLDLAAFDAMYDKCINLFNGLRDAFDTGPARTTTPDHTTGT